MWFTVAALGPFLPHGSALERLHERRFFCLVGSMTGVSARKPCHNHDTKNCARPAGTCIQRIGSDSDPKLALSR
jgi:hypothetical protein